MINNTVYGIVEITILLILVYFAFKLGAYTERTKYAKQVKIYMETMNKVRTEMVNLKDQFNCIGDKLAEAKTKLKSTTNDMKEEK